MLTSHQRLSLVLAFTLSLVATGCSVISTPAPQVAPPSFELEVPAPHVPQPCDARAVAQVPLLENPRTNAVWDALDAMESGDRGPAAALLESRGDRVGAARRSLACTEVVGGDVEGVFSLLDVGKTLLLEGELARHAGLPQAAADSALDAYAFAQVTAGDAMVGRMGSLFVEMQALDLLEDVAPGIPAEGRVDLASRLVALDSRRAPLSYTLESEAYFVEHRYVEVADRGGIGERLGAAAAVVLAPHHAERVRDLARVIDIVPAGDEARVRQELERFRGGRFDYLARGTREVLMDMIQGDAEVRRRTRMFAARYLTDPPSMPVDPFTRGALAIEPETVVHSSVSSDALMALTGSTGAGREVRALLHRAHDGSFDGYRVSGIRVGSTADEVGLRNGDVVHAVNGLPLDSVQSAMEAYGEVRAGETLELRLTRAGEPHTLVIDVD